MLQLSVWEKESFYASSDIVIAGSGFVGLWSAFYLKRSNPSLSITILERGLIPTGASTRNAGFACFGSVTELLAHSKHSGEEEMLRLAEMRFKGLKKITRIFPEHTIGYENLGGYELITEPSDIDKLRSDIDGLNRSLKKITGQQKTFRLKDDRIRDFGFNGIGHLIENKLESQLHSGRLCQALLRLVQSMGVTVLNGVGIASFEKINGKLRLQTEQGPYLDTSRLLVCTNAFARQLLPDLDIVPARGQVLVTSPIKKLPFRGTFHFDEGFYYFRNLGDRVLLGGARNKDIEAETTTEMTTTEPIQQELERFLKETILPGREYSIDYRWSGIMGMGSERWPIVKELQEDVFCCVRMSGMGVALAPVVAQKAARLMLGD